MLLIDTPIALLVGTAIALKSVGSENSIDDRYRAFSRGLLVQSLVITPLTVLFLLHFSDWQVSYLADAASVMASPIGPWLAIAFIIWLNLFYVIGFKVGEKLIYSSKRHQLTLIVQGLIGLILIVTALVFREILFLGTTAQYHLGTASSAGENLEFLALVIIGFPLWVAAYFWAIRTPKTRSLSDLTVRNEGKQK